MTRPGEPGNHPFEGDSWGEWKVAFGSEAGETTWHATVDLPGGERYYARWDPTASRGFLVQLPWNDISPVTDLGWWPTQMAYALALNEWVTRSIPLGTDPYLPRPDLVDGPAVPLGEGRAIGERSAPTPDMRGSHQAVLDLSIAVPEATRVAAFMGQRPARRIANHDHGFLWQDPTGAIPGAWRLTWSDASREAWLVRQPDGPDSALLPLGEWPDHSSFLAAIPDWAAHAEHSGLDWLLRSTGHAHLLDRSAHDRTLHREDTVPHWAPPGSRGSIDAELMRRVLGGAIGSSGHTVGDIAESLRFDPAWVAGVLDGTIDRVPATAAVRLANELSCFPEDLYGPDAGTAIAWVNGAQLDIDVVNSRPPEPPPAPEL